MSALNFNVPTWRSKAGFGGRVLLTKRAVAAQPASFSAPQGAVFPSSFHDKDAEDVKQKQLEEQAEERETFSMGQEDHPKEPEKLEVELLEGLHDSSIPSEHTTGLEVIPQAAARRPKRPGEVKLRAFLVMMRLTLLFCLQWKLRLMLHKILACLHQ